MKRFKLSELTSEKAYALVYNEITDDQAVHSDIGGDSDADDDLQMSSSCSSKSVSRSSTLASNSYSKPSCSKDNSNVSDSSKGNSNVSDKISEDIIDGSDFSSDDDQADPNYIPENEIWGNRKTLASYSSDEESEEESESEGHILEDKVDDSEENTVKPPTKKKEKTINWTKTKPLPDLNFKYFRFDQPFGVKDDIATDNVLSIFQLFFDNHIMQIIVDQSNLYASQKGIELNLDAEELRAFFGLLILFGINRLPSIRLYWSNNPNFYNERVTTVMTMKRFLRILRHLHLSDNEKMPSREEQGYNKLYKVQPLLTHLSDKFKKTLAPSRNLAIDESMVAFKGRTSLKQYMPLKPIKRGIKIWAIACSQTGYMFDFQVYQGKSPDTEQQGLGDRVVLDLSKPFIGKGFCLYFDNFFNSFPLLEKLLENKLFGCGTFRINRKFFPHDKLCANKDLSLGSFDFASAGDLTVYKWKDRSIKPVIMASNMHDPSNTTTVKRKNKQGEKKEVTCPMAIRDYNQYMGGVDLFDQLHSTYNIAWKSHRWWMKLLYYFVDAAVVNSYIVYKTKYKTETHTVKPLTHLQFRSCLIDQLIGTYSGTAKKGRPSNEQGVGRKNNSRLGRSTIKNSIRLMNVGSHLPKISTYRRCAFCSTKQHQKRSNIVCTACNVALCKKCFEPFHKNQH